MAILERIIYMYKLDFFDEISLLIYYRWYIYIYMMEIYKLSHSRGCAVAAWILKFDWLFQYTNAIIYRKLHIGKHLIGYFQYCYHYYTQCFTLYISTVYYRIHTISLILGRAAALRRKICFSKKSLIIQVFFLLPTFILFLILLNYKRTLPIKWASLLSKNLAYINNYINNNVRC